MSPAGAALMASRATPPPRPQKSRRDGPRDTRRFRRVVMALVMVVPAACIAVSRVVSPGLLAEDSGEVLREVSAAPGRSLAATWLSAVTVFTLVPAFQTASRLAMRRRPVLATMAATVNGIAYLGMGLTFAAMGPLYLVASEQPGSHQGVLGEFLDELSSSTWGTISGLSFIIGHLLGAVLLGFALRGTLPRWAWVAMAVSMPAHLVVYVGLQNMVLDGLCWGLAALAFARCAVHLVRMDDDEWELPPVRAQSRARLPARPRVGACLH